MLKLIKWKFVGICLTIYRSTLVLRDTNTLKILVSENQSCLFVAPVCIFMYFSKAALGCLGQERGQQMFGVS